MNDNFLAINRSSKHMLIVRWPPAFIRLHFVGSP